MWTHHHHHQQQQQQQTELCNMPRNRLRCILRTSLNLPAATLDLVRDRGFGHLEKDSCLSLGFALSSECLLATGPHSHRPTKEREPGHRAPATLWDIVGYLDRFVGVTQKSVPLQSCNIQPYNLTERPCLHSLVLTLFPLSNLPLGGS